MFACPLHDVTQNLIKADHGYWGAQLFAPYVDERVSWGIKYHQALRFFPDSSVGYAYPDMYNRIFGVDYEPDEYIKKDYEFARNHRYYMEARLVTVNDQCVRREPAQDPHRGVHRRHRPAVQAAEGGAGVRQQPVAHMWRSIINPDRPL